MLKSNIYFFHLKNKTTNTNFIRHVIVLYYTLFEKIYSNLNMDMHSGALISNKFQKTNKYL